MITGSSSGQTYPVRLGVWPAASDGEIEAAAELEAATVPAEVIGSGDPADSEVALATAGEPVATAETLPPATVERSNKVPTARAIIATPSTKIRGIRAPVFGRRAGRSGASRSRESVTDRL